MFTEERWLEANAADAEHCLRQIAETSVALIPDEFKERAERLQAGCFELGQDLRQHFKAAAGLPESTEQ